MQARNSRWASFRGLLCVGVGVLALAACSGNVEFSFGGESADDAAVTLIEGQEMQDLLKLGPITGAVCDEPASTDIGTLFDCTAETDQGQLEYEVEIDAEDHIFASPQNVISADIQARFAAGAARALSDQFNSPLPEEAIDCGDAAVILTATPVLECAYTSPDTGDVFDATITITDLDDGSFNIEIGDAPR